MGYQVLDPSDLITGIAGADLSTKQFFLAQFELKSGALKVVIAATAGQRVDGVLQDKPSADGTACLLAGSGITKVVADGPVLPGEYLMATSAGRACTASATGYYRVGKALEQATVQGDKIAMLLKNYGQNVP